MTGTPLELYTLTYDRNIHKGIANHNDIVKEVKIGKSASKILSLFKINYWQIIKNCV